MPLSLSISREGNEPERHGNEIDYLPFGIKTVKVAVDGNFQGKLRLRPQRFSPGYQGGEMFAHEDHGDPPQFVISWGGGHEAYYELDYPKKRVAHFLVHHLGKGLDDYPLTIKAEDEKGQVYSLMLTLTYPEEGGIPWPASDLVKADWQEQTGGRNGISDIVLSGRYVPDYISRWWPRNRVIYDAFGTAPPHVRLRYKRILEGESDSGQLTAFVSKSPGLPETALANMGGRIPYPLYDMQQVVPELFRFGPQTWALRTWFFWLDKEISIEDLSRYGTRTAGEIDAAWREIAVQEQGGTAKRSWSERHEIPDAERVDIIFDNDFQVLYAATDLHWRELWGIYIVQDHPLQVQIMNTRPADLVKDRRELKKVVEGWGSVLVKQLLPWLKSRPPFKPHEEVMDELAGQGKLAANPLSMESHTPAFLNVKMQTRFTSTDVTDG